MNTEDLNGMRLVRVDEEPNDEVRYLRHCIAELQRAHQEQLKPYIDRLVRIESIRKRTYFMEKLDSSL